MQNKIKIIKKIFILITFQFLLIQNVSSITIEGFDIQGNDRVSDQTVIMFSSLNIGDEINDNVLNVILTLIIYSKCKDKFNKGIFFDRDGTLIDVPTYTGIKPKSFKRIIKFILKDR